MKKIHYLLMGIALLIIVVAVFAFKTPSITGNVVNSEQLTEDTTTNEVAEPLKEQVSDNNILVTGDSLNLIKEVLLIRQSSKDKNIVEIAKHYTILDESLLDATLINKWVEINECVYSSCEERNYLNLIDSLASTNLENQKNELIHNTIQTHYLWGGKNQGQFSKALTTTNSLFNSQPENLRSFWEKRIECDTCKQSTDIVYEIIEEILK